METESKKRGRKRKLGKIEHALTVGLNRVTVKRPESELARYYNPLPADAQYVMFAIRTDERIVQTLYQYSDRHYKGKVNVLTDKIINDYIDIHDGDLLLTDYRGISNSYRYNLQMKKATLDRLMDMADKYGEPKRSYSKNGIIFMATSG